MAFHAAANSHSQIKQKKVCWKKNHFSLSERRRGSSFLPSTFLLSFAWQEIGPFVFRRQKYQKSLFLNNGEINLAFLLSITYHDAKKASFIHQDDTRIGRKGEVRVFISLDEGAMPWGKKTDGSLHLQSNEWLLGLFCLTLRKVFASHSLIRSFGQLEKWL